MAAIEGGGKSDAAGDKAGAAGGESKVYHIILFRNHVWAHDWRYFLYLIISILCFFTVSSPI